MPVNGLGDGPTTLPRSPSRASTGRPSGRKLDRKALGARVPAKAKEVVDKLAVKVRVETDQKPSVPTDEIEREEKRDAKGFFTKGTKPGPGRPPGSPNQIPKSIKAVMHALSEGVIEVSYLDPLTGQPTTGPVAHLLAEKIGEGLTLPAKDAHAYVKTMLEYGIGRPRTQSESGAGDTKQIPRMIFLNRPKDSFAPDDGKPRPMMILGQVAGPNGEIVDVRTGNVVVPAPAKPVSGDDGLGEGEDRLELV